MHPCNGNGVFLVVYCTLFLTMHNIIYEKLAVLLLPIWSLYRYLAGALTFLYPLATKLFTIYAHWCQKCCCLSLLAPKPLFKSLYPGLLIEKHQNVLKPVFRLKLYDFQMIFSLKERLAWNSPVYHLVSDYFNIKYILL